MNADTQRWLSGHSLTASGEWIPPSQPTLRFMDPESLCPDLLGLDYIGEADHLRGRVIRAFFRLMRLWPKPRPEALKPDPDFGKYTRWGAGA